MIYKRNNAGWDKTQVLTYKNEPGTWMNVTRQLLMPHSTTGFEVRYFEIDSGGYTSHEKHDHEHCVIVLEGTGEVYVNGQWQIVNRGDAIHIPSQEPHQFRNLQVEKFGILCIVNRERDRPELLGPMPE